MPSPSPGTPCGAVCRAQQGGRGRQASSEQVESWALPDATPQMHPPPTATDLPPAPSILFASSSSYSWRKCGTRGAALHIRLIGGWSESWPPTSPKALDPRPLHRCHASDPPPERGGASIESGRRPSSQPSAIWGGPPALAGGLRATAPLLQASVASPAQLQPLAAAHLSRVEEAPELGGVAPPPMGLNGGVQKPSRDWQPRSVGGV